MVESSDEVCECNDGRTSGRNEGFLTLVFRRSKSRPQSFEMSHQKEYNELITTESNLY